MPREEARARLGRLKHALGCCDCGTHEGRLEWDHVYPASKKFELSSELAGHTWPEILLEVAKCVVRCTSCHSKRTRRMDPRCL